MLEDSLRIFENKVKSNYASTNTSLPIPQIGHTQSSGISSKAVPGAIPLSGSPTSGSYS